MKKPKLPKKPNLPKVNKRPFKRTKSVEERVSDAISVVPRITNETVADHREDVLSSARKYIYPLQHSKHSIVRISISIFVLVVLGFLLFCGLDLYKFQDTSGFIYDVTKIIPFPAAKVDGHYVSYESYLFELRPKVHYYRTQQQADFSKKDGQAQLQLLKRESMNMAIEDSLVNVLAKQNNVSISNQAVNEQVALVRQQNRLGSSNSVFGEVLSDYYGWSEADFKTELKEEMLQQAVVTKLDTTVSAKANAVLKQIQSGANFATEAATYSDDASTKGNGGQYPSAITIDDYNIPPAITADLFKLKAGQVSGVINTGYSLDIVKVIDTNGVSLHAAHIQFNLNSIDTYTKPLQDKTKMHEYIKV
jgi:hypothetical protein